MADTLALAEVRLWGNTVGAVVEQDDGRIVFEYDPAFRNLGLDISPINLPLSVSGPVGFDELVRNEAFNGLPGVLADALPDSFGNSVIRAWYAARGQPDKALSPVQRLLYIGERAIGALTFHPAEPLKLRAAETEALDIAQLVRDARRIIDGEVEVTIPEIYRISASAGGMRAKAVVLYCPETGEIRSSNAAPVAGDIPALLKFDGIGDDRTATRLGAPATFNRVEAAYAAMARDAGVNMADVQMLETSDGYAHLVIRRFDRRADGTRLHQHTLGGLLHVSYNEPGASSYEEYLRVALRLGLPPAEIDEAFRRMVFNVAAVNQDDHVKNMSFHMYPDGSWHLTPAYDVTFAKGGGYTRMHQMRVADKTSGINRRDILGVAKTFRIRNGEKIIDRALDVLAHWSEYAAATGVAKKTVRAIDAELKGRHDTLAT